MRGWMGQGGWIGVLAVVGSAIGWAQAPDLERMDIVLKSIPNGPVALVGSQAIPADEFRDLYIGELVRLQRMGPKRELSDADRIEIAMNCLRLLTERSILYQESGRRRITVEEMVVAEAWKREVERLGKTLSKDPAQPLSEEDVLKLAGVTREKALEELHRTLVIERMREQILKDKGVAITEKEVADFYEANRSRSQQADRVRLQQVFIRSAAGQPGRDAARGRAETVLARIRAGQSFAAIAKAESDGPFKETGGEMGPVPFDRLPEPLQEAVLEMGPGDLSGVIETEHGFHIFKLLEIIPGKNLTLEELTPQIRRLLLSRKSNEAVRQFCEEVTSGEGYIQVYLDLDKQLSVKPDLQQDLERLWAGEISNETDSS